MAMDEPNGNDQSIMSGIENTGGVLHNRKKLRQRFDIIKKLGQGTYGKVQLGINKETGQEVAIKTIKKCKIESSADLIRIRREVQIMSSVRHPNIIHIYEVFENREKMVLVMEYAAGGELYDYLSSRKVLAEEEARRIFRQIATAIYYCHKHKICHRDLKLENILLDENGNAKIADFGLSNVFAEQRTLSTYCGSPLYASPEIVTGTPYNGPEVDCWSLGVLLYTMVYGAMPFDGTHFKTLVKQISLGDYFEPKKKSPASSLIKDMLTVSSKERADVERICAHWWVNEGYEHSCLDIAEELASQTPVRLDLLLSLNPQTVDSEKLVVTEDQVAAKEANEAMEVSASAAMLTRSQSADSVLDSQVAAPPDTEGEHGIKPSLTKVITPSVDIVEEARANSSKRKLDVMESTDKVAKPSKVKPKTSSNETESNETITEPGSKATKDDKAPVEKKKIVKKKVPPQNENDKLASPKEVSQVMNNLDAPEAVAVNNTEAIKQENKDESMAKVKPRIVKKKIVPKAEDSESVENDANVDNTANNVQKTKERRVSVGEHKQQFERRASLNSATPPPTLERKGSLLIDCTPPSTPEINGTSRPFKKPQSELQACVTQSENVLDSIEKLMNHLNVENQGNEENAIKKEEPATEKSEQKSPEEEKTDLSISLSLEDARKSLEHSINLINEEKKRSDKELNKKLLPSNEKARDGISKEQQMKHAVETISNAIPRLCIGGRKPPVPYGAYGRSSSMGPSIGTLEKMKLQGPLDTFNYTQEQTVGVDKSQSSDSPQQVSATLPRRKVSTAEIKLRKPEPKADAGRLSFKNAPPMTFRTEVEHKVGDLRSAPVRPATEGNRMWGSVSQMRSASLEPEKRDNASKERIVPIQVHPEVPRTPSYQRTTSMKSGSLSRQNTADSDGGESIASNTTTSTMPAGAEPIRKSPREVIIPIAVEGGGYVTPRATSVEPSESSTRTLGSRNRTGARRLNSLLSDSGDEAGTFGRLHRHSSIGRDSDGEDGRFHLHRLRSSRPSRGLLEPSDSVSSGEDDDDDGFELLTAENLFSTLLSRVRSLTQRLNVDEDGRPTFPRSSLLNSPFGSHKPFWERDPLARRLNSGFGAPSWRRSTSRDTEGSFGSPDWSSNNTLPRGRKSRTVSNQDSSKIPIVNNNNYSINDPSNLELDLADLDLSRLKLSQSELDALTSLTPNLSQRQQNQLLSQLPPTQARKLSRHLSLRLPKTSQQSDKEDNLTVNNDQTLPNPVELRTTPKSYSLRNSFRHSAEPQNDTNYNKKNDISAYGLINNSVDRQFDKYLPLQKASSLVDSNTDRVKTRKPTPQRRISRFLRPDFFDTPRDESSYAKEKRERELETQQVLREIRVKRDRSVDRCHASVSTDSSLSRDINTLKYIPKSLPSESTLHSEKESTCSEKTVANNEKTRRSSTELSKIARPKSLIMNKEDNTSNANEEISKGTKTNSISKLPTKQSKKESKLLRPKSYPNSSFSTKNGLSLSLKKEDENNIETKVEDEQNIVNDKKK
ncbi:uncharacterized protein LOC113378489 isoform X2 [Ctenocephalides felis]|uniref:uncharacterized protein LOC113378489 isoform X2 n=1 Tax=Ctenocephalides felis TaxID=7515 RepID=UPI000E6E16C4|nr:uncharacterized protein LOC113378489 isoform X2 [Ctenocephalides felis]